MSHSCLVLISYFSSCLPKDWTQIYYIIKFRNRRFNQLGYCPTDLDTVEREWAGTQNRYLTKNTLSTLVAHRNEPNHNLDWCYFNSKSMQFIKAKMYRKCFRSSLVNMRLFSYSISLFLTDLLSAKCWIFNNRSDLRIKKVKNKLKEISYTI